MFRGILLAALGLAFLDLYLLYQIGSAYGFWAVLAVIVLPALLGTRLAWHQGLRCLAAIQVELAAGRAPSQKVAEAPFILAAGLLMVYPGPVTTGLGVLLLIPGLRRAIARMALRGAGKRRAVASSVTASPHGGVCVSFFRPGVTRAGPGAPVLKDVEGREVDSRPSLPDGRALGDASPDERRG